MRSLASRNFESACQVENTVTAFVVHGWDNPHPLTALIDPDRIGALREQIAADVAALLPRCENLDAALPESARRHRGYVRSRQPKRFDPVFASAVPHSPAKPLRIDPPAAIRHQKVESRPDNLGAFLSSLERMLSVGEPFDPSLRSALGIRANAPTLVAPGEGDRIATISGRFRPSPNSFAAWMALQEEAERSAIDCFVLTRTAGVEDVALLRHRVHPHQRIVVEGGSPALTWLLAVWDGVPTRIENVFVLCEPGPNFREPSTRRRLSDSEPWPRISVVTVSYNQCEYLEQCVRSVIDQRYPNLEYIVVDGGSTDGSAELLRDYQERYACFSHLIIEPDHGQSDGLNKGLRLATGEVLTWVNSDDMLAPLSLKRAAMALRETGADMVAGTCRRVAGAGATLLYKHFAALPTLQPESLQVHAPLNWRQSWEKGDWFFQPEVLFTREIWERAGAYLKPHLFWAMDWDLWLRFALAGARVVRIPDVIGASREHATQKTTGDELYLWQIVGILREYDGLLAELDLLLAGGSSG
jgi:GT2 family glycosyltransferase